jgi:glucose/arabinose dehydrogenase
LRAVEVTMIRPVSIMLALWAGAASAATVRELTQFTIALRGTDETFAVGTDRTEVIERCREQLSRPVAERTLFVAGELVAGHGGGNLGWSWHLDPDTWDLVEAAIELCDGRPSLVEDDLEYWLESVGSFCPWSSYVLAEGVPWRPADPSAVAVELEAVIDGLEAPLGLVNAADGSGRLFVVEKAGRVRVVDDGRLMPAAFLDLTDRVRSSASEQGLLGLAFAPDFTVSGRLYVNYTALDGDTTISRLTAASPAGPVDPDTEEVLLTISQPFSNHNGGDIAFGPDGMLWIATGDGGSGGDPLGSGQDRLSLLGKMLRIDVAPPAGYRIPDDNPFADIDDALSEIWALGLRNPWRFAFDGLTGDLYIADVGQNAWEEIDVEGAADPGGRNYGWNRMEGFSCYPSPPCDPGGLVLPAAVYGHDEGCSVTGGRVYRGTAEPALYGSYVFVDFCSGRIWALAPGGPHGWVVADVGRHPGSIAAFGEDEAGELYAVDLQRGQLLRLRATTIGAAPRRPLGRVQP